MLLENMNKTEFLKTMQKKVSVSAVGPSALRSQGKGVLAATQEILSEIDLSAIPMGKQEDFNNWLDRQTGIILNAMPIKEKPWGAGRKALNLFLRDSLNNRYLCDEYEISKIENWLEIPLDSVVAKGLKEKDKNLPRWTGLKYLKKEISDLFQKTALRISEKDKIARVHLDMILWLENR
jgi:hypothetical protein